MAGTARWPRYGGGVVRRARTGRRGRREGGGLGARKTANGAGRQAGAGGGRGARRQFCGRPRREGDAPAPAPELQSARLPHQGPGARASPPPKPASCVLRPASPEAPRTPPRRLVQEARQHAFALLLTQQQRDPRTPGVGTGADRPKCVPSSRQGPAPRLASPAAWGVGYSSVQLNFTSNSIRFSAVQVTSFPAHF